MGNCFGHSPSTEEEKFEVPTNEGEEKKKKNKKKKEKENKPLVDFRPTTQSLPGIAPLCSPLHIAVLRGNHEIVTMLLERGSDANARDRNGKTPLMVACQNGDEGITMALLLFNCDIWMAEDARGWTALHYAVSSEDVASIRLLVSCIYSDLPRFAGSECDARSKLSEFIDKADYGGLTALHLAAYIQHADCTRLLLDLHADASPKTFEAGTVCSSSSSSSTSVGKGSSDLAAPFWPYQAITSILRVTREQGISYSSISCDSCRQRTAIVTARGCGHAFCTICAVLLCSSILTRRSWLSVTCPLEREEIVGFRKTRGRGTSHPTWGNVPSYY